MTDVIEKTEEEVSGMTLESFKAMYDSLQFFDGDLNPKNIPAWREAQNDDAYRMQLLMEMLFVSKLETIRRDYERRKQYEYSPFKQKQFKKVLTSPDTKTDEFGNVLNFGMKMDLEEYEMFEELYNEIFITEDVE